MADTALAWCAATCSVVRVAVDGTKKPLGAWKPYTRHAADLDTVRAWFAGGHPGVGVVCGAVSGNLEMLELEGRAMADGTGQRFFTALDDHGLADVKRRIVDGYCEKSPSGGVHLLFRVDGTPVLGNEKLAQRPNPDPDATQKAFPLIETRGEGGFTVVAPSHGPVHETGSPWVRVAGSPATIATLTADEYEALHGVAHLFDEMPPPPALPNPAPRSKTDEARPGDDYNSRADWDEVLTPAGWVAAERNGTRTLWRRPGKRIGVSAATGGPGGDYLYVWTTSTELPPEQGLSKWRAYALINHGGDFRAAAKALSAAGYGQRSTPPQPHRPVLTVLPGYGSNGSAPNSALATALAAPPAPSGTTTHARTDDAQALALVDTHGETIRYCPERGRWLVWTGHVWQWCPLGGGVIREHAKAVARALPEDDAADVRFKVHCLSAPGTTNIVHQASSDPRVVVRLADLDAHPYELNTPTGIIDLRTGALIAPDPARLHTRTTLVDADPAAHSYAWDAFLGRTFAGHPDDLIGYVQRLVGYSATGAVRDHVLPFCYGSGANGKSVLLGVVSVILGDYATAAPAGFLMAQRYAKHEAEIAELAGRRFVMCSELNEGDKFDESRVKMLTGNDAIKARFMRQDYFTFTPTHHLWLAGNHQPSITSGGGPAFWRRLRIVPFTNVVPPTEQDPDLADTLTRDHGTAILAWIVAGAVAYFRDGMQEPASVHVATEDYEHDQDSVARFIDECCLVGGGEQVTTTIAIVRAAYEKWCAGESLTPVGTRTFSLTLRDRFGVTYTTGGRNPRRYVGLALPESRSDSWSTTRRDLM